MANLTTESNIEFDGSIPFSVVHGTKVAAGVKILRGGMVFEIDGVLFKAGDLTQAPLLAKILSVAGVDGNGGIRVYSKLPNVRYQQITGGNNKVFGITVTPGATIDVIVQLATDGAGASTTTAAALINALSGNDFAAENLGFGYSGTGAGLTAASTITNVPRINMPGIMMETVDNAASGSDLAGDFGIFRGYARLNTITGDPVTATMIGSMAEIVDDNTVKATPGTLGWKLRVVNHRNGLPYCEIK